jgi:hypothetical protein
MTVPVPPLGLASRAARLLSQRRSRGNGQHHRASLATWLAVAVASSSCTGAPPSGQDVVVPTPSIPGDMLGKTWQVRFATSGAQDALIAPSPAGWKAVLIDRNYKTGARQLGGAGGLSAARAHEDVADLYRQGALLAAWSYIRTYGDTPDPTDPVGTAHVLTISYAIVGDLANARASSARLDGIDDPTTAWHAPWKAWLAEPNPTWPPDLSSLPLDFPAEAAGEWPESPPMPHYTLAIEGSTSALDLGDPGVLVALAKWHDDVARTAAGDQAAAVDSYGARFRLPAEAHVTATAPLPDELLFGSDYLVPDDAQFMAELTGDKGPSAVDAWKSTSVLAWMADRARIDGKVDAQTAVDLAAELRREVIAAEVTANGGVEDSSQRRFGDMAQVGALRTLALVAEAEGNREASGVLRINAMERSEESWTHCPVGLMSLAAWDASNRYPQRGLDILDDVIPRYPSLEVARYGLDVLALRVSREQTRQPPG